MAWLSGRPLRLTLLMARIRSPTWMAPVLGGRTGERTGVRDLKWAVCPPGTQETQSTSLDDPR